MMAAEARRRPRLSKRMPKNSGIVCEPSPCVMRRVREPSTTQASRLPMMALPMPIHVDDRPNFQPNWPA